jgi:hypothetical protein
MWVAPYRAYDPALARWISEDPIGLDGGVNRYAYVQNTPITMLDPEGLFAVISKLRCIYYQWKCPREAIPCREQLKNVDPLLLCERTNSKYLFEAIWKICVQRYESCRKMLKYCGESVTGKF